MCHVHKVLKASDDWLPIRQSVCVCVSREREVCGAREGVGVVAWGGMRGEGGQRPGAELMRKTAVFVPVLPTNQVSQF